MNIFYMHENWSEQQQKGIQVPMWSIKFEKNLISRFLFKFIDRFYFGY